MLLYHGTSELNFNKIISTGRLSPRGRKAGSWQATVTSNPKAVYLTSAYAGYFALCARRNQKNAGRAVVIEVDTSKLDESLFAPDEDVLEQSLRDRDDMPGSMKERTLYYRNVALKHYGPQWKQSLEGMGTVCYYDHIPVEALTRVAIVDPKECELFSMFLDPSISILNYRICGGRYRAITRWLFGEAIDLSELHMLGDNKQAGEDFLKNAPADYVAAQQAALSSCRGIEVGQFT